MTVANIVAALLIVLPGVPITRLLQRDATKPLGDFIAESIVWSLLLAGFPAWFPLGDSIPLVAWTWLLIALAAAGLAVLAVQYGRGLPTLPDSRVRIGLMAFCTALIVGYATVLIVRPIIDWDAITYYFTTALQWFKSGHVTATSYPWVTTVPGTPLVQPPIVPSAYAIALLVAAVTRGSLHDSVRLIPLVFVVGTFFSIKRLAANLLPENVARFAAPLWLTLPGVTNLVVTVPLYLDLGTTFAFTAFLAELTSGDRTARGFLKLSALAALLVMVKVDGMVLVALALAAVIGVRAGRIAGGAFALAVGLALVAVSWHIGFITRDYPLGLLIALSVCIVLAVALCVSGNWRLRESLPHDWRGATAAILGILPAALYVAHLTLMVGSPAAMYIPDWAHSLGTQWHVAVSAVRTANIYSGFQPSGVPGAYGLALLIHWGFAPLVGLLAFVALLHAIRYKSGLKELAAIVVMCDIAFLTIFHYQAMRHLMPTTSAIVVLAVGGIGVIARKSREMLAVVLSVAALSILPFAWAGQQIFFTDAYAVLSKIHWDQWSLELPQTLYPTGLFGAILLAVVIIPWSRAIRSRAGIASLCAVFATIVLLCVFFQNYLTAVLIAAAVLVIAIPLSLVLRRRTTRWAAAATAIAFCAVLFWPLIAAAISPGFGVEAQQVVQDEDFGYYTVLSPLLHNSSITKLLTFKSYGIAWFSMGRMARVELNDATDVSYYHDALYSRDIHDVVQRLGVQGAIFPYYGTSDWFALRRLLANLHLMSLTQMDDPLIAHATAGPPRKTAWSFLQLYPATTGALSPRLSLVTASGVVIRASDRDSYFDPKGLDARALRIDGLPAHLRSAKVPVTLTWVTNAFAPYQREIIDTIHVQGDGSSITLPIAQLNSPILEGLEEPGLVSITIGNGMETYDFRSEGLGICCLRAGAAHVTGLPFVLRPDLGIVADVEASLGSASDSTRLYPGPPKNPPDVQLAGLTITLRPSRDCVDPFRAKVIVHASRTLTLNTAIQERGGVRVRRWNANSRTPLLLDALQRINVEANQPSCRVHEILDFAGPSGGFHVLSAGS